MAQRNQARKQDMPRSAILCVDDEVVVLDSLEIELTRVFAKDYVIEFAEGADEALEIIEELREDEIEVIVIVSDWLMPGMKGDELLIVIHNKYPNIVTIMLSGQADQEAIERVRTQANLHAYLHKPWDANQLIDAINSGLDKL